MYHYSRFGEITAPGSIPVYVNGEIFDSIKLRETFVTMIVTIALILQLPSRVGYWILINVFSQVYVNKASNYRLMALLAHLISLINVLIIPAALYLSGFGVLNAILGAVLISFISIIANSFQFSQIIRSRGTIIAEINNQIEQTIINEKNTKQRCVKVEALIAIKKYFELFGSKTKDLLFSTMCAGIVAQKLKLTKKTKDLEGLSAETNQLIWLMAANN